ncbi:MAG TPA: hypothetical protein RMH99_14920 [Sandaracinaceae bacterium LLY-WYZ-13_1]|nr:hypothetical protein [Sandaracinaceae bacterium LLY-WYZ-13_1]
MPKDFRGSAGRKAGPFRRRIDGSGAATVFRGPIMRRILAFLLLLAACDERSVERAEAPPPAPEPLPSEASPPEPSASPVPAMLALSDDGRLVRRTPVGDEASEAGLPSLPSSDDGPRAERLVAISDDGDAVLVRLSVGHALLERGADAARVNPEARDARFSPDGRHVVWMERQRRARCGGRVWRPHLSLLDRATGEEVRIAGDFLGFTDTGVRTVMVRAECAPAGGLHRHVLQSRTRRFDGRTLDDESELVARGARGREARVVSVTEGLGGIRGCRVAVGEARFELPGPACRPSSFAFSPDGRWLAHPAGEEGTARVRVRDAATGAPVAALEAGPRDDGARPVALCWAPDGEHLVVRRTDGTLDRTDPRGADHRTLGRGRCLGFSPGGRWLLLEVDGEVRLRDLRSGSVRTLDGVVSARWLPA